MLHAAQTAKQIMVQLNEIHPAVSGAGMEVESEIIRGMKKDLGGLIAEVTPPPTVLLKVLEAGRTDVVSSAEALSEQLQAFLNCDGSRDSKSDYELQVAKLAAESFVASVADYLSSKVTFKNIFGEKHVAI